MNDNSYTCAACGKFMKNGRLWRSQLLLLIMFYQKR